MRCKTVQVALLCALLCIALLVSTFIQLGQYTVAFATEGMSTFYSTDSDGSLWYYADSYNTVHDGNSAIVLFDAALILYIGQYYTDGPSTEFGIHRGGLFFDTSGLPDTALITSATLSLKGFGDKSDRDFDITVVNGSVLDDPLQVTDYGDLLNQTTSGGSFDTSGFFVSPTDYNDIPLNNIGIGWISKTGMTKFGLRSSFDIAANAPSGNEYVQVYANENGPPCVPKLVVTWWRGGVGGEVYPVNKAKLLAPWLALAALTAVSLGTVVVLRRRRAA